MAAAKRTASRKTKKRTAKKTAKKTTKKRAAKKTAKKPAAKKATKKRAVAKPGAAKPAPSSIPATEEGRPAPDFELTDASGRRVRSSDLRGKPFVLYFYPKDNTPGCTAEACGFRDSLNRFSESGVKVLGVSPDSGQSHQRFIDKYGLNFPLLSDGEKTVAQAYGVWVKKQNYGREYMGIQRSTFLVDENGIVRRAWRGVRVPGHVDEVLAEAARLR